MCVQLVRAPFEKLMAKYASSERPEVKNARAKYEPMLATATQLIPFVAEGEEVAALAARCDSGNAVYYVRDSLFRVALRVVCALI
jgi:hypothetical protein